MQLLQVGSEVMDALGVQEFADDVGGFQVTHSRHVLGHGSIVVPSCMQMIPVPLLYLCHNAVFRLQTRITAAIKAVLSWRAWRAFAMPDWALYNPGL